jgi:hypothetical protein
MGTQNDGFLMNWLGMTGAEYLAQHGGAGTYDDVLALLRARKPARYELLALSTDAITRVLREREAQINLTREVRPAPPLVGAFREEAAIDDLAGPIPATKLDDIYVRAGRFAAEVAMLAKKHPETAADVLRVSRNLLDATRQMLEDSPLPEAVAAVETQRGRS